MADETWEPDVALTGCSPRRWGKGAEEAWLVTIDGRDAGMVARDDRDVYMARHPDSTLQGGFGTRDEAIAVLAAPFRPAPEPDDEG